MTPVPPHRPHGLRPALSLRQWRVWVLAASVGLPLLVFGVAGALWLHERHWLGWAGLIFLAGEALFFWLFRRWNLTRAALPPPPSDLPPTFTARDEAAWTLVQDYLDRIERGEIVVEGPEQCVTLGRDILERIATHYHPTTPEPLLAVQLPLLLRALEETARDLAQATAMLPLAHRLTIGDVMRGYRLHQRILPAYNIYRLLYPLFNWQNALFKLLVTDRLFDLTRQTIQQWLLTWYVDRIGYHAIALYSGKLLLTRPVAATPAPLSPETARTLAAVQTEAVEPLRLLVLGQVKAGKSSLVNALFGTLQAATDVLPTTTQVQTYVLDRPDLGGTLLVSDMGGYDAPGGYSTRMEEACAEAQRADLLLLVSSAVNAAREPDRRVLEQLRTHFARQPALRPPPVLVVLTHIDLLRPHRIWAPPYNIVRPDSPKAQAIHDAVHAVAADLRLSPELMVPVSLLPERLYNLEEALVPLLIQNLPDAKRVLLLRSLKMLRQQEAWELLARQARAAGQFLWRLGSAVAQKALR